VLAELRWGILLTEHARVQEGIQVLDRAIPDLIATEELEGLCVAYHHLCSLCFPGPQWERLDRYAAALRETAERWDNSRYFAHQGIFLGEAAFYRGDWRRARADLQAAGALLHERRGSCQQAVSDADWPWVETRLGRLDVCEGRPAEAESRFTQILTAEGPVPGEDILTIHLCRAEAALLAGHAAVARQHLDRVSGPWVDPLFEWQDTSYWGPRQLLLAWALDELGESARADALVAEVLDYAIETGHVLDLADARWIRTLLAARRGVALAETEAELDRSGALSDPPPLPYAYAKLLYAAGLLAARASEPARARERFEQAIAICERLGERFYHSHIERALAELPSSCA
jgi:tetratricopeptide (TPR) repeat protein